MRDFITMDTCYHADDFDSANIKIFNENCFDMLKKIPDKSVDFMFADLPYNCTDCKWDKDVIDLELLWKHLKRVAKSDKVAFVFTCTTAFGYKLIKANEKMFKMDLVWKKRNKTGGLNSRFRPMRNHEMVYFFYKKAPKYNRDKYHKRVKTQYPSAHNQQTLAKPIKNNGDKVEVHQYSPPNPGSVVEHESIYKIENDMTEEQKKAYKEKGGGHIYEPKNPASVIVLQDGCDNVQAESIYNKACGGKGFAHPDFVAQGGMSKYEPVNPGSVIEEYTADGLHKITTLIPPGKKVHDDFGFSKKESIKGVKTSDGWGYNHDPDEPFAEVNGLKGPHFQPGLPVSVLDEEHLFADAHVFDLGEFESEPPNSIYTSKKVFIGKRNHQTEKPVDLMSYLLKYWTDEGDVVLDPTMGSGSMGVACAQMNRKFVGAELTEKYFNVAVNRIKNKK